MVSLMHQPLYPQGKSAGDRLMAGLVVPGASLEVLEPAGVRNPDCPARSLVILSNTLSHFL